MRIPVIEVNPVVSVFVALNTICVVRHISTMLLVSLSYEIHPERLTKVGVIGL